MPLHFGKKYVQCTEKIIIAFHSLLAMPLVRLMLQISGNATTVHLVQRLLNSASGKSCDKIFVDNFLTRRSSFCNITNFQCTASVMCNLIKNLPLQKSAGADGITAEHLRYAHYCVCIYLSVLFNLCISHGFITEDCLITDIVPILKCKNKDATNVGNYRSIAVSITISKFFKHFILFHIKPFFVNY